MNSERVVLLSPCLSSSANVSYTDTGISGTALATKIVAQDARDFDLWGVSIPRR